MTRYSLFNAAAIVALIVPGMAVAQSEQTQPTGEQPEVAQQCLQDVQRLNQELLNAGYGTPLAAPDAVPGAGTVGAVPPTARGYYGALESPRGEMRALMQAAYVLAMNGDEQACQMVLANMENIVEDAQAAATGGDPGTWRDEVIATAVPVTEIGNTIQMDRVLGADVLGRNGEDLGDIDDVILGDNGPQYILVSRGGFLGMGEDLIPVRWRDLQVTASPYQDTFVLNTTEDAFENAPTVADSPEETGADWQQVERFWDEALGG